MRQKPSKPRRVVLRLRDLDCSRSAVLNSLGSPASRRAYEFAIDEFIAWYCSEPCLAFSRIIVARFRMSLEARGLSSSSINQRLAAVRRLAYEAADCGLAALNPPLSKWSTSKRARGTGPSSIWSAKAATSALSQRRSGSKTRSIAGPQRPASRTDDCFGPSAGPARSSPRRTHDGIHSPTILGLSFRRGTGYRGAHIHARKWSGGADIRRTSAGGSSVNSSGECGHLQRARGL